VPNSSGALTAVVVSGGKQYRVAAGDRILVDRMAVEPGAQLALERVLMIADGDELSPGDILAKIPRETTRTKDITGGLPRVVELFEARKPRETAIIAEINGVVKYGEVPPSSPTM